MEDNIFDISFEHDGTRYTGWVNPSANLGEGSHPASFHVVLNSTFFGDLSYHNRKWTVNEERPDPVVNKIGKAIEDHYKL